MVALQNGAYIWTVGGHQLMPGTNLPITKMANATSLFDLR